MRLYQRLFPFAGILALTSLKLSGQAAQTPEGIGVVLEPFPVVGTRLGSLEPAARPDAVVLDRELIDHSGALDLSDLLGRLPQTYGGAASGIATVPNGMPAYGSATALFNFVSGAATPLRQTGVSSVGLGGIGAGGTLVLIDGRRVPLATQEDWGSSTSSGFYDLSSIPLSMVERVEVLPHGASALYGSDAVGGVVNIVLRRDYNGNELTLGFRATEGGGGFERHAALSRGLVEGSLRLFLSVTTQSQQALKASQRAFSAHQDFTARGGRDQRLMVGSPGSIIAVDGPLNGVTDAEGNPTRYALVPIGQKGGRLTTDDFTGAAGFSASGLRYFNTAPYKDLIGASDQQGLRLTADYTVNPRWAAFAEINWSDHSSTTDHEPPAVAGGGFDSTAPLVPADNVLNPFGQDVLVALVLVEMPPRTQFVDTEVFRAVAGLRGLIGPIWQWETAAAYSHEDFDSRTLDLNTPAFLAALADGRYNPFADPTTQGPINAGLVDELTQTSRVAGTSALMTLNFAAHGPVFSLPGGDASLALGLEATRAVRHRRSTDPVFGQPAEFEGNRTTSAAFTELYLPLFGGNDAPPLLHRFGGRFAVRYERTDVFAETSPSAGLYWQPWPLLQFNANYAEGFRAPALSELENVVYTTTSTIIDPHRAGESYTVSMQRGSNLNVRPETSRTYQFGVTLQPPPLPGLRFRATTNETYYENKLTVLPDQTLIDFESRWPTRIERDPAGRIATVDATTMNFGKVYLRHIGLSLSYEREYASLGRLKLNIDASRQLDYRVESRPGTAATSYADGTDTASPPKWSGLASLQWRRIAWDAVLLVNHIAGYDSNGTGTFLDYATAYPSWTTLDFRIGYTFPRGFWRDWGKGARLQLGVGNLTDRAPPFANTVYGYNPSLHSPLGRTYDFNLRLPF